MADETEKLDTNEAEELNTKPLENVRHEKFALALFKGMSHKDAAIEAGYKPSRARQTASRLVTNGNILGRILVLHKMAESDAIMSVKERKERLSDIARGDLTDFVVNGEPELTKDTPHKGAAAEFYKRHGVNKQGDPVITKSIKLHNPITAIGELNKMEGQYPAAKLEVAGKDGRPIPVAVTVIEKVKDYGN